MSSRMSENERAYYFVFLFPPLWPLGLAMVMCDAAEGIRNGIVFLYRRFVRRKPKA